MIFAKPIPFAEALAARAIKALLPTTATAAQLEQLAPAIKHRATFSARTAAASHLAEIDRVVNRIVGFAPEYDRDPQTGQVRRTTPGDYINETRARQILRQSLADIGYDPQDIDAAPGSLKDLASRQRIHVILDTNVRMARNYGTWKQGQDSAILDVWPCQELVRHQSRDERRDWHRTWAEAGGRVSPGYGLDGKPGRLVARKDDPIWSRISRFGAPYPPFDYLSGVGVDDVDREESVRLGIIQERDQVPPRLEPFNDTLQAAPPADPQSQSTLFAAILQTLGNQVVFQNGVLSFRS